MWSATGMFALIPLLAAPAPACESTAYASVADQRIALGNRYLERGLDLGGGAVHTVYLENKLTGKRLTVDSREFVLGLDGATELSAADFRRSAAASILDLPGGGKRVLVPLSHATLGLGVKVVYEVLPDEFYTRKWLEITLPKAEHLVNTIDVERLRIDGASLFLGGPAPKGRDWLQTGLTTRLGQPVYADNFFLGVEYPAAENSIDPAGWIAMRCYLGRKMRQQTLESKRGVIGVAPGTPLNRVGDWFLEYIARIRVAPVRRFTQWESWWTSKHPTEAKVMLMIDKVKAEFLDHGIPLDAYLFSAFWETDGWQVNPKAFPRGLEPIKRRLDELGLGMGLWMGFTMGGGDRKWLESQGYETTEGGDACYAGGKWAAHVKRTFLGYVKDNRLNCWKNDYTGYSCGKTDHGHLGGLYGVSAHADTMIDILQGARRIKPDFYAYDSFWLSPWWLMYVDVVWPDLCDYMVEETFPAWNARDNQITSRDGYMHRRIVADKWQFPIHSMQTCEPIRAAPPEVFRGMEPAEPGSAETPQFVGEEDPLDRWTNNIVMHYCRGTSLTELYVSPWLLEGGYGDRLRAVMRWGVDQTGVLLPATRIIQGNPRQLEVYGYAHFPKGRARGLIGLRNPAFTRQRAAIALDESAGLAASAGPMVFQVLYPYRKTLDGTYRYGDKVECMLEGYQTLVLDATAVADLPQPVLAGLQCRTLERDRGKIVYEAMGPPGTEQAYRIISRRDGVSARLDGRLLRHADAAPARLWFPGEPRRLAARRDGGSQAGDLIVDVPEGFTRAELTILYRGPGAEKLPLTMTRNGRPVALKSIKPNRSSYFVTPGSGWQFFRTVLPAAVSRLAYVLPSGVERLSVIASISAEAPLAKHRMELTFPETTDPPPERNPLPLLYPDSQQQVVEIELRR